MRRQRLMRILSTVLTLFIISSAPTSVSAQFVNSNPVWIWSNGSVDGQIAPETCHFRKKIQVPKEATVFLEIAAKDRFELYFNGARIGVGENSESMVRFDLTNRCRDGENLLAVRVNNRTQGSAGLAATVAVTVAGHTKTTVTDATWRSTKRARPFWNRTFYNDAKWLPAQTLGHFRDNSRALAAAKEAVGQRKKVNTFTQPPVPNGASEGIASHGQLNRHGQPNNLAGTPRQPNPGALSSNADVSRNVTAPKNLLQPNMVAPQSVANGQPNGQPNVQPNGQRIGTDPTQGTNAAVAHQEAIPRLSQPQNQRVQSQRAQNQRPRNQHAQNQQTPGRKVAQPTRRAIDAAKLKTPEFQTPPGFAVQHVASHADVGSLIAMTFNEFGQIVAARENSTLALILDRDGDGTFESVQECNSTIKNVQGIVALNGSLFVVGQGPSGNGMYRLDDPNLDGFFENDRLLFKFKGDAGEHGAHGITFGPDGMLYVILGNHTAADAEFDGNSPYRNPYEGDLVKRFEDPSGHANNVKAPGGTIIRTDLDGHRVERFAGGIRNAYDLAFDSNGNLFTHDSDMEFDSGTTWFRPTRVLNVTAGSEFGWRSGWGKWPEYFYDSLPSIAETGRGSPTGLVVYDHSSFPKQYRNAVFSGDWLNGQILVMRLVEKGAGFEAKSNAFLRGKPLNVTDLDVGPDGWLYFTTGGRGTSGNVYRVTWSGEKPNAEPPLQGIDVALKQPQFHSAWARQRVATLQAEMGAAWMEQLTAASRDLNRPVRERVRALDVMRLFGPATTTELILQISNDTSPSLRAKSANLLVYLADVAARKRLSEMLNDPSPIVRKSVCEALVRAGQQIDVRALEPTLASQDRFESTAARRLLEFMPLKSWRPMVLESNEPRVFLQGGLAMMVADPSKENAQAVIARGQKHAEGFLSDRDFRDLLRLYQVAIHRSKLDNATTVALGESLAEEYPSTDHVINRELVRLLTHLQVASIADRYFSELEREDLPIEEHLHLATHLTLLKNGWSRDDKFRLFKHLEPKPEAGNAVPGYLQNISINFSETLTAEEVKYAVENGARWPSAALAAVMKFPATLSPDQFKQLEMLDGRLAKSNGENGDRLKVAVVALMARDGSAESMAYLRNLLDRNDSRRKEIIYGLAENVDRTNVSYLAQHLDVLDIKTQRDVLKKMQTQVRNPKSAASYRAIFAAAERLKDNGADDAIAVLERWQGYQPSRGKIHWSQALIAWKNWYATKYPNEPLQATAQALQARSTPTTTKSVPQSVAISPTSPARSTQLANNASSNSAVQQGTLSSAKSKDGKWDYDLLLQQITQSQQSRSGSVQRGRHVFIKAQCNKCHRHGSIGETMGPILTNLAQRFRTSEILESIIDPSKVISNQYTAKQVLTSDGKVYTGIVAAGAAGQVAILQTNGRKIRIPQDDIEHIKESKVSAMPEGGIDELSLQEVVDLFAFLTSSQTGRVSKSPALRLKR